MLIATYELIAMVLVLMLPSDWVNVTQEQYLQACRELLLKFCREP